MKWVVVVVVVGCLLPPLLLSWKEAGKPEMRRVLRILSQYNCVVKIRVRQYNRVTTVPNTITDFIHGF